MPLDVTAAGAHVADTWATEIVPILHDYIRIPALSPAYDAEWAEHGHLAKAVELLRAWSVGRRIEGLTIEVHELPGRTPVLLMEVPAFGGGSADDTVLLYGHLDKQPEMTGWRSGLGPWVPVLEGDRLYGRGGADDGYSTFAALTAIEAVQAAGGSHARCIVLIEASEESGSPDLPAHMDALADRIGEPSLVIALDSGCLDYDRLWVTTSLRGLTGGRLTVEILREGVHSGTASGVVPSTFRIARVLLDRIEDATTGLMLLPELHVDIPPDRLAEAEATAAERPEPAAAEYPWVEAARPMTDDPVEQLLARTWRPTLSVTGADGLPPTAVAGNVLRPSTSLQLSVRLPPICDPALAEAALTKALTTDPPYGAHVTFEGESGLGWNAPPSAPWLTDALDVASAATFGAPARTFGEGGSIPFMGMLGAQFPAAQFLITGVLGPDSNAHGPNEYLHVPTGERVTTCVAAVLDAHARR